MPDLRIIKTLQGHTDSVWYAEFSPDGQYLFAGSEVWDIGAETIIHTLDDVARDLS